MNSSAFIQTGGYPLKSERLQELQTSFKIFNAFGNIAGNFTIVEGCETEGSIVKNGKIYIHPELLDFREADATGNPNVIIIEEAVQRPFENGTVKTVYLNRYATFGTAEISWPWSNFKRPFQTKDIPNNLLMQLNAIPGKAETGTVTTLAERVTALEEKINNMITPQISVMYGRQTVNSWTSNGDYSSDFNRNYIDVYPPSGYTMAHFKGIVPSVSQIKFDGDVDDNDVIWCSYQVRSTNIRIICGNVEQKAAPMVSYMAIFIK
ncbi:hypothetical protein [Flavobacterium johnsoniae]|uniref:Uncharacterized protein n=1 Tax=Flavobacterium johnsoniae TaxID=986 RepID=A0A1M5VJF3_FLAJO|nr:hypothetical protein [Flavobacterium johnsoniae]SHH75376.1 hypothetical protein SAMN05444388_11815 [Flavobacterium johnsoniae]